jgi:hypothetical protein
LLFGAISGSAAVLAHLSAAPRQAVPPAVTKENPATNPAPSPNVSPRSTPQPADGSGPLVADNDNCPDNECPLSGSDNSRPYCPISMAANALSRMFASLHAPAGSSR